MQRIHVRFLIVMSCASLLAMTGCMASTRNLNTEAETHYDATYDFSDKNQIVNRLVTPLLSAPVFPVQEKPILIVYPVESQRENIQKETDYQYQGYVDPAMLVEEGRQLGADYILSGTLRSIKKEQPKQWRLFKKERIYYSLDLSITDLKTGEIVYADQAEIAREASQPIIGW
jgi:curli biogenesis system outer membrane secretion channel CsgG